MNRADKWPQPILHVVRLKPGETQTFELGFPWSDFPREPSSGRQFSWVQLLQKSESPWLAATNTAANPIRVYANDQGVWELGTGLNLVWESDKPGISFRAAHDAPPGTI